MSDKIRIRVRCTRKVYVDQGVETSVVRESIHAICIAFGLGLKDATAFYDFGCDGEGAEYVVSPHQLGLLMAFGISEDPSPAGSLFVLIDAKVFMTYDVVDFS